MPRASRSPWPPSIAWFGRGVEVIGSSGMSNTGRNYYYSTRSRQTLQLLDYMGNGQTILVNNTKGKDWG